MVSCKVESKGYLLFAMYIVDIDIQQTGQIVV